MMLKKIMRFYVPEIIKKKMLHELLALTAAAFQSEPPLLKGLPFAECLAAYALFTKEQAEHCLQAQQSLKGVKSCLFENSYVFGQKLRKSLHIVTPKEAIAVLEIVYKLIGIDFLYDGQGGFIVKQCFFSKYYSPGVCRLISALDEGMAAGLVCGKLSFSQRITEGGDCCRGVLVI